MKMRLINMLMITGLVFVSCKRETAYIYEVDPVKVKKDQTGKNVPKSTVEFISIAYSDLTGKTITQTMLSQLSLIYLSFGDKRLVEDMLIKNLLNAPEVKERMESNQQMRGDIPAFVRALYLKLFNREPNELELWTTGQKITSNTALEPVMVYYAMMTSDEYRYY
jgi:hypothetical protein